MAKFESFGYCPYNEIVHTQESVWLNDLDDEERGQRKALWNLVGPYMVCDSCNTPYEVKSGKIFFGTKVLADLILISIVERYDFSKKAPIWIKQPRNPDSSTIDVAKYIIEVKEKNPELCFSCNDAGKIAVICNGEVEGEIIIAFWNISLD